MGWWRKSRPRRSEEHRGTTLYGCLFAIGSALLTCGLLFLNGALVSALCATFGDSAPRILQNPQVLQFVLFVGPVVLVVMEWIMIDYAMNAFRR